MHSLQKQFHDFIDKEDLLRKKGKILLAVSGGLDSMVLCHLFAHYSHEYAIAHCNFNLRGKESGGDELFVKKWAEENGISFHTKSFRIEEGSIQLRARQVRYQWFDELCQEFGYGGVATAHHLNDSLETFLINLTRGTGIKGLTGIKPESKNVIRPLLSATREQLHEYAKYHKIQWREDSSNATTDYDRNLVRHEVLPKLMELNPSLPETFFDTSERLRFTNEQFLKRVNEIRETYLSEENGKKKLLLSWITEKSDLVVLAEILSAFDFNYRTAKEVFGAIGKPGKVFHGEVFSVSMDRGALFIQEKRTADSGELVIKSEGEFVFGAHQITLTMEADHSISKDPFEACFDSGGVSFPLTLRKWENGDRFNPLGMAGSKKVSDYLIDKKIPLALKNDVLVLISKGEIIWLAGHQISEKVKVTDRTKSVLRIKLS